MEKSDLAHIPTLKYYLTLERIININKVRIKYGGHGGQIKGRYLRKVLKSKLPSNLHFYIKHESSKGKDSAKNIYIFQYLCL